MALIAALDEAGKGPVIGPMIVAGILIEKEKESTLQGKGIKDSKLLSQAQRVKLASFIKREVADYCIITIPPKEIDAAVTKGGKLYNLNWLEADKMIEIIRKMDPDTAIIDCPSTNIKKFTAYLQRRIDKDIQLVVEHKADVHHVSCAAASILAKCKREEEVAKLKKKYGNFGSGYPSDPTTQKFLKKNWNTIPHIFRRSWSSWKKYAEQKKQKHLATFIKP